jgi:DNA (cytosine-5)-methyltransferase 1
VGYARAGFEVVGVDHIDQPNYPFRFYRHDALAVLRNVAEHGHALGRFFDVIHASPPCQAYSTVTGRNSRARHASLIAPTRELLEATGLPYVIENVEGARRDLRYPTRICGSAFRDDLQRHRYFETNWPLMAPACAHGRRRAQFRSLDSKMVARGAKATVVGVHGHLNYPGELELRRAAMEIDWMTLEELNQAIPPAYTELIGHQLVTYLDAQAREPA